MKITIIGDIHGRLIWKDIVNKEQNSDLFIFLGDYVDTHDNISTEQQITNLENILNFKEHNPNKVVLLRGNHDLSEINYSWAECSNWNYDISQFMQSIKDIFIDLTQWIYVYKNIVFSHAGISETWMNNSQIKSISDINNLPPSEIFGFTPDRYGDYTGDSITQPPVWIRPQSLIMSTPKDIIQVIGHTPVKHLSNYKNLWLCDALDVKEYLVYEDEIFSIKTIPS